MFDPNTFMSDTITGATDTKYVPVPQGEYPAIIKSLSARQIPSRQDPSKQMTIVDIVYEIDDSTVKEATGLDAPTVRQSVFLELTERGKIDNSKGKNVPLGKVRDALGLNNPDKPFALTDLVGRAAVVTVEHTPNEKSPGDVYANVTKVGKL